MKAHKVLLALAVLGLVAVGTAQASIVVSVEPDSFSGITSATGDSVEFTDPTAYPTDWIPINLGTITTSASGWVNWKVTIGAESHTFLQDVTLSGTTLTLGAVPAEGYVTFTGSPTWEVRIPAASVEGYTAGSEVSVTGEIKDSIPSIPEPATLAVWSLLGLSGAGMWMARRRKGAGRAPWSDEARAAIHQIVGRGRA